MKPRIKICCISSMAEANLAIAAGASAIGLVGPMPSGPGVIDDSLIREIAKHIPPPVASFLLTSETSAEGILQHYSKTLTTTIQLVDAVSKETYSEIRKRIPPVKLVQVIHVLDEKSIEEAIEISEFVDGILLDSGNPGLKVKVLGGTGKVHNWKLSQKIREAVSVPVFLAGGLHPENIKEAVDAVQPFGVDVCSGVRTQGMLDPQKLAAFVKAVL